ncbi:tripartite tricarboxylate transporter TctB family protein [Sediminicurvatus halobius]|uniref:DUF1468 domain-containing protein n=1 Tax=Sediminicurvatus halobius TaxID=2182432 RepID=A0A2U2NA10_9GAMM|nr:tripartite tricarboxylate transporter TctB family protein [Spiribacter halobius]PWG65834.1 hypothetical protein DEM34_00795 [Spiribacter halobius]UEX77878.1 tripartite tricarboxylate transporter TctB family protein [Spiribacter halobius]
MNRVNVASGLACVAFAGWVYWMALSLPTAGALDPLGGAFLPKALAVVLALLGAALAITGLLGIGVPGGQAAAPKPGTPATRREEEDTAEPAPESIRRVLAYAAGLVAYVWLMPVIGFLLSSFVAFTYFITVLGQRHPVKAPLAAAGITAGLYLLFGVLFGVRLPVGTLFQ